MPVFYPNKKLNATLAKACDQHQLTLQKRLSNAAPSCAWLCSDNKNNEYLLKVRKRKGKKYKEEFIKEALFNKFQASPPQIVKYDFTKAPEYLLYSFIKGTALNKRYFFLDPHQISTIKNINIIKKQLLSFQQKTNSFNAFSARLYLDKILRSR